MVVLELGWYIILPVSEGIVLIAWMGLPLLSDAYIYTLYKHPIITLINTAVWLSHEYIAIQLA